MSYREADGMFEVEYHDENGKKRTVQYCAESKSEAQKMFNEEKEPGDKLLSVRKIN